MPLNESNFLMWFADGESQFDTDLPRPFMREPETLSPAVWLVPGEQYTFWFNTLDNKVVADALEIISATTNQSTIINAQALQQITFAGNGAHRICTFSIPALPSGMYQLKLGSRRSQYVFVTNQAFAMQFSAIVRFRSSNRIRSFRYGHAPDDFYQVFRVRLAFGGRDPETNRKVYQEGTTAKTQPLFSQSRQLVTILTPEYDRYAHDAMFCMLEHDEVYINGRPYAFAQAYKSNETRDEVLTTGEFQVSDEQYATMQRS